MFQRKSRRFRRHSNDRGHSLRRNGHAKTGLRSNNFLNSQTRNNFRPAQSPEKLLEKYNALAKAAMSSGDKTLCENFLQHADHFARIIEDKNKNKEQNKVSVINKSPADDKHSSKNSDIKQEDITKNKE